MKNSKPFLYLPIAVDMADFCDAATLSSKSLGASNRSIMTSTRVIQLGLANCGSAMSCSNSFRVLTVTDLVFVCPSPRVSRSWVHFQFAMSLYFLGLHEAGALELMTTLDMRMVGTYLCIP